ncbi:MAG: pirin family protein [Omnitrophica WOR_2 bacterium]|jgi:redox-sensitive bicupin YhaK (pirin superfamily)
MDSPVLSIHKLGFQWVTKDPFLFCAHHNDLYPHGNELMGPSSSLKGHSMGNDFSEQLEWRMYHGRQVPGFPVHPHRGFETITVVLSGFIDHTDSAGGAGRYGNGDVQWMTAGTGLQHSEMFPLVNKDQNNPLELFQIWLNLPRSKKMVNPYFKMLWKEGIPKIKVEDKNGIVTTVTIITGSSNGMTVKAPAPDSWAADPDNEVSILRIEMEPSGTFIIPPASSTVNRMLFFYLGKDIKINDEWIESHHSVDLNPEIGIIINNGDQKSELMLLQGKPINEPVVQYGPFVMNSQQEIQQTVADYRRTEFGGWPWPDDEYVHGGEPRFARYADGSVEYPEGTDK